MSRQDKATTERNAKVLRELVKRPENKVCADCKRNDPRWASWNIGVFVCIRCSGIHRSMGTHISKVKSVDLDMWTAEQMQSIQKWGNLRANLYWEAHLKPGHIPPDHKMDSFIRSKYESRRWALEGPPPSDPSILESERPPVQPAETELSVPPATPIAPMATQRLAAAPPSALPSVPRPPSHILLSSSLSTATRNSSVASATASPAVQVQPAAPSKPLDDLFSLDFQPPPPANPSSAAKDTKSDILSLFGPAPSAAPLATQTTSPVSLVNSQGAAMWGAQPMFSAAAAPFAAPAQPNHIPPSTFGADVWAVQNDPFASFGGSAPAPAAPAPKNDAFSDLWGDFK